MSTLTLTESSEEDRASSLWGLLQWCCWCCNYQLTTGRSRRYHELQHDDDDEEVTEDIRYKVTQALPQQGLIKREDYALSSLECVICLETFDKLNPLIPVLCNCGANRVAFHYPCLLMYLEHKSHCPVCKEELFYEENDHSIANTEYT